MMEFIHDNPGWSTIIMALPFIFMSLLALGLGAAAKRADIEAERDYEYLRRLRGKDEHDSQT